MASHQFLSSLAKAVEPLLSKAKGSKKTAASHAAVVKRAASAATDADKKSMLNSQ